MNTYFTFFFFPEGILFEKDKNYKDARKLYSVVQLAITYFQQCRVSYQRTDQKSPLEKHMSCAVGECPAAAAWKSLTEAERKDAIG